MSENTVVVKVNNVTIPHEFTMGIVANLLKPANVATSQAIEAARVLESVEGLLDSIKAGTKSDKIVMLEGDKKLRETTREKFVGWIEASLACGILRDSVDGAITRYGEAKKSLQDVAPVAF